MLLPGERVEARRWTERAVILERERPLIAEGITDFALRLELDRALDGIAESSLESRIGYYGQRAPACSDHRRQLVSPAILGVTGPGITDFLGHAEIERQVPVFRRSGR